MESHGVPAQIQVTEETAMLLEGSFRLVERGVVEVKVKGPMRTFWLLGEATSEVGVLHGSAKLGP
jgi:hypothetical protein